MEKLHTHNFVEMSAIPQLDDFLSKNFPDYVPEPVELYEQTKASIDLRDEIVQKLDIAELLQLHHINLPRIEKYSDSVYKIELQNNDYLSDFPDTYAVSGGTARYLFEKELGFSFIHEPRDIDVVRIHSDQNTDMDEIDRKMAETYMAVDFSHGHGVQVIQSIDTYMATRDITLNEVLCTKNTLYFSEDCLRDTVRHIIRSTQYEINEAGEIYQKILAKIVRLYAEAIVNYDIEYSISEDAEFQIERFFISPFYLALHLDKAWERGEQVANKYCEELIKKGQVPTTCKTPQDVAEYLINIMYGDFYYRNAPIDQYATEDELADLTQDSLMARIRRRKKL